MHIGRTSHQKSLKSPEHGEKLVILIWDQWISAGVFHARLLSGGGKSDDFCGVCVTGRDPTGLLQPTCLHVSPGMFLSASVCSASSSSCRLFPSLLQRLSSDLRCSLHSGRRGPIRLQIRLDLRGERSRCASSSVTERQSILFQPVSSYLFSVGLFEPTLNIPLKNSVSAQIQRQADAET